MATVMRRRLGVGAVEALVAVRWFAGASRPTSTGGRLVGIRPARSPGPIAFTGAAAADGRDEPRPTGQIEVSRTPPNAPIAPDDLWRRLPLHVGVLEHSKPAGRAVGGHPPVPGSRPARPARRTAPGRIMITGLGATDSYASSGM